jgi:hypothetical protein
MYFNQLRALFLYDFHFITLLRVSAILIPHHQGEYIIFLTLPVGGKLIPPKRGGEW